jgi:hypothetical protein
MKIEFRRFETPSPFCEIYIDDLYALSLQGRNGVYVDVDHVKMTRLKPGGSVTLDWNKSVEINNRFPRVSIYVDGKMRLSCEIYERVWRPMWSDLGGSSSMSVEWNEQKELDDDEDEI